MWGVRFYKIFCRAHRSAAIFKNKIPLVLLLNASKITTCPLFSRLQPPGILCFKFNICKSLTCNNQYFNQCVSHNIWLVNKPVSDHIVSNYCKLLMGGCTRFDVEPISCNLLGLLIKNIPITLYMLNFKLCAPSRYTYGRVSSYQNTFRCYS